jgi:predicted phage terminase large subunit-like protein
LDVWCAREQPDVVITELFRIVSQYNPITVGIEVVAYQKMLAQEIKKQMRIRDSWFYLEEVRPMGDKVARINATLRARYATGNVFHVKPCRNNSSLEAQMIKYPHAKHDDMVDALSGAVSLLDTRRRGNRGQSFRIDMTHLVK